MQVSAIGVVDGAWLGRRLGDIALAGVVLTAVAAMDVLGPDQRGPQALVWDLALTAPLLLRRVYPEAAAALLGLVCLLQWMWGPPVMGDVAVLVMLYTLSTRAGVRDTPRARWSLVVAVLIAQLGVVMAVTRWQPDEIPLTLIMVTGTVTASWGAGIYVRTRRAWAVSLRERAETAERERDHLAQMAVASERARIARELHDVVAHSLSVMITLNDAAAAVGSPGQVRDTVEQASEVGRDALAEMHRLLGVLREQDPAHPTDPAALSVGGAEGGCDTPAGTGAGVRAGDGGRGYRPQPGTAQLADLAALVRSAGPEVELSTTGDLSVLPPSMQLAAYRVVQESLTNVIKHARNVDKVVVDLALHGDRLEICVTDDGQSHPVTSPANGRSEVAAPPSGLGLLGMRERALVFAGTVQAGPHQGRGWRVTTSLTRPRATWQAPSPTKT